MISSECHLKLGPCSHFLPRRWVPSQLLREFRRTGFCILLGKMALSAHLDTRIHIVSMLLVLIIISFDEISAARDFAPFPWSLRYLVSSL
jgi:hypothetical protein